MSQASLQKIAVRTLSLATMFLAVATPLRAQNDLKDIPNPDPEVERRSFQVAEGFEVNLFAADPMLAKPIQMNFDSAGRLWVVSSEVYPQIMPGQVANDKVVVLEDVDGDGRSDKTTIFADGLLIPTGIEPGDGGAYVANSTELLFLKDTDGDGKADHRRVMLSGFGTEDTHHILHTLRWGHDGMLYMNQSIYIHSHIETPYGVRRLNGGGVWQFRPETMRLEVFVRGLVNGWGHHIDRWGQSFLTDGAGGEGINYALPGAYFVTAPDAVRILKGLNPGSPKHCGIEILSGRHLPDDYRGSVLTNDFRGNRVCRFVLSDDGAGYASREQAELIKTKHSAFRPIDVKMGPDGAIYIADWYNPIIQHGEVDFRDPRRDHTRGRIWRVTAKGRPLVDRPKLIGASTEDLLKALKAPEDWTRHHAKRMLKERGASIVPALAAWAKGIVPEAKGDDIEHHRLEALWTYQAIDVVEPELLARLLKSSDPRIRAAATRVVGHWHARLSEPLTLLAPLAVDDHPRVRLEAVRVLGQIPQPRSAELALAAMEKPIDPFLDYALWLTVRDLKAHWLPAVQAGRLDFGGDARRLRFALEAIGSPAVVAPLMEALRAGKIAKDQEEGTLTLIAALGGPQDLGAIFDLAVADGASNGRRQSLLASLTRATRQRKVRPSGDLTRLGRLLDSRDETLRVEAARAVGLWKVEPLRRKLLEGLGSKGLEAPARRALIEGLAALGGPESRSALEELAKGGQPLDVRMAAVVGLAALDLNAGANRAVEVFSGAGGSTSEAPEVVNGFLQRRGGPAALASALANHKIPEDVAKIGIRTIRASGRDEPALVAALTRAGGVAPAATALSPSEMGRLTAEIAQNGNPIRGEAIFRRKEAGCLKCHAIAGAGGQVGPDLVSIGASAPVDYLIDSILQPNKAVKENYNSLIVATNDGRIATGIKARQTDSALILRDVDDREMMIPLDAIEEQKPGGSLMPVGLADSLTRAELVDLVRFLSELGKVGSPYAVGQERVIRRWQALETNEQVITLLQQSGPDGLVRSDAEIPWDPVYSQVSGILPLGDAPTIKLPDGKGAWSFIRCRLDATTGGKVGLALNSVDGLKLWIDGKEIEPSKEVVADLPAGSHVVTLGVDRSKRRDGLRCELKDVPGSPARVQAVVGK